MTDQSAIPNQINSINSKPAEVLRFLREQAAINVYRLNPLFDIPGAFKNLSREKVAFSLVYPVGMLDMIVKTVLDKHPNTQIVKLSRNTHLIVDPQLILTLTSDDLRQSTHSHHPHNDHIFTKGDVVVPDGKGGTKRIAGAFHPVGEIFGQYPDGEAADTVATVSGLRHQNQRRDTFRITDHFQVIHDFTVSRIRELFRNHAASGEPVTFEQHVSPITYAAMIKVIFGGDISDEDALKEGEMLHEIMQRVAGRAVATSAVGPKAAKRMVKFDLDEVKNHVEMSHNKYGNAQGLYDKLLTIPTSATDSTPRYNKEVAAAIAGAMTEAANDTTSTAIMRFLKVWTDHPQFFQKLMQIKDPAEFEAYLDQIAWEFLRYCVIVSLSLRKSSHDVEIRQANGELYTVRAGDSVILSYYGGLRHPGAWGPDALEFNPERQLTEEQKAWITLAFGPTGERHCMGADIVIQELKSIVKDMQADGIEPKSTTGGKEIRAASNRILDQKTVLGKMEA